MIKTQIYGKFVAIPPVFEAIQWNGTLNGSVEILQFINERLERPDPNYLEFRARVDNVNSDEDPFSRAIIRLDPYIIRNEHPEDREMWSDMWLVYCARPRSWRLVSDENFKLDYQRTS